MGVGRRGQWRSIRSINKQYAFFLKANMALRAINSGLISKLQYNRPESYKRDPEKTTNCRTVLETQKEGLKQN